MSKYVGLKIGKVHKEHIESEYYCGGCGWPVTDHDSYCPECGGAFQRSFADDALEVENAKLRELCRHMYACIQHIDRAEERGCGCCPYRSVGVSCEFEMPLLELGIEVE